MTTGALQERPASNRVARRIKNWAMIGLSSIAATIAVGALVFVLAYLLKQGFHSLNLHMLTNTPNPNDPSKDGFANSLTGTIFLIFIASLFGLPIGILGGIYQVESQGPFATTIRFLTDVLNSIPSIVIGIFIYILVVLPVSAYSQAHNLSNIQGNSAFAGGVALGILMIPTVMRTTEEILRLVPSSLREGSLALGATRWRTMFSIVLPAARNGVITGIMLASARIAGETAPLLFTAFGNPDISFKLFQPVDSLPWSIYKNSTEPGGEAKAHVAALILILLILVMSLITRFATRNSLTEEK